MTELTVATLRTEARGFALQVSALSVTELYGVTDGKAVGTYLEHRFQEHLKHRYSFQEGSSAKGIDFPGIKVDVKVTSARQPQSSSPFRSARQKIYGLGYSLLVFVYEKTDDDQSRTANLAMRHVVFVDSSRTADFQTTRGLDQLMQNSANEDDIVAFLEERYLPVDEIEARNLAREILRDPPELGYITISNALQWRLQYRRVIDMAGQIEGITRVL